jgi:hypothetical protein
MARKINRLNAQAVKGIKKFGRHADGGGLYLSISPNGGRRWTFLYRWHGKPTEIGFGSARDVTLGRACELAAQARSKLAERPPSNPKDARKPIGGSTFGECADPLTLTGMDPGELTAMDPPHAACVDRFDFRPAPDEATVLRTVSAAVGWPGLLGIQFVGVRRRTRFAQIFHGRRGRPWRCGGVRPAARRSGRVRKSRNQRYCSALTCQRVRRRRRQQAKRQSDADYRENQARAQRAWVERHRDYWRAYRRTHPQYCESNRLAARRRQRERRRGGAQFAKMDAWVVEMTLISIPYGGAAEVCKEDVIGGTEVLALVHEHAMPGS